MDLLKFVALDDTTHIIGPGEYTVCGIVIPQASTYTTDQPKKLCSDCKSRAKDTDEFGVTKQAFEEAAPEPLATEPVDEPAPKSTKEATTTKAKATK